MITKTNNRTLLAMSGVTYDFDFRIDDAAELEVYGITAGGVATQLTTGFTAAFSAADEEGTVTFDAEPSTYAEILMLRNRPYTQTTDIPIRGGFSEEDIEKALDQIVIQIQQLKELIDYCVKLDATSEQLDITLPAPVDGKALLWDGVTGALANSTINIEEFETEAAAAIQAAIDAGTAQTAAEAAQSAAEAAAAAIPDKATQAQAEAGLIDTAYMTPLKTAQAIAALASGKVLQIARYNIATVATGTTVIPWDDTIPQNTEGDQYMSLAVTPVSATSNLYIVVSIIGRHTATNTIVTGALFVDTTANALSAASKGSFSESNQFTFDHWVSSGSTDARTYKVRIGATDAGTFTLNGSAGGRKLGGVQSSTITVFEVAA